MKGIYLTQESKQEIEKELNRCATLMEDLNSKGQKSRPTALLGRIGLLEQILASAIVLPVVSWEDTYQTLLTDALNKEEFEQGVIIQPKNNCGVHIHNPKTGHCKCGHKVEIKTIHST